MHRPLVRTVLFLLAMVFGISSLGLTHGGGILRGVWDGSRYRIAVQTDEAPHASWVGGVIHVTTVVMPKASGEHSRLRNLTVRASGILEDGSDDGLVVGRGNSGGQETSGPLRSIVSLSGEYEVDLPVRTPGMWRVIVEVDDGQIVDTVDFVVEVKPRNLFGDVAVVGGLMSVPIIGLIGMTRTARKRRAKKSA